MKIHTLGDLPKSYDLPTQHEFIAYTSEVPPFAVDALVVFSGGDSVDASVELLQRSGRPVLNLHPAPAAAPENATKLEKWLSGLAHLPRTNYQPINCNFYDNFEAAIVQRRKVELEYRSTYGTPTKLSTRLKDLKTDRTEEYVQLENGQWLRLDRIISVDGEAAGASCRF